MRVRELETTAAEHSTEKAALEKEVANHKEKVAELTNQLEQVEISWVYFCSDKLFPTVFSSSCLIHMKLLNYPEI